MSSNYLENQIDDAFHGRGWPEGKDGAALLREAAAEIRAFRGSLSDTLLEMEGFKARLEDAVAQNEKLRKQELSAALQSNETLALQRDHWLAVAREKDAQVERMRVASTRLIVAMRRDNWPGRDHGYVRELTALIGMQSEPQTEKP